MSKKDGVPNRQYTDEFKVEAVRLGDSIGKSQAAKRLGIPDSSLWNWIKLNRAGNLKAGASRPVALDHIEGVLIAAAEPMLNKKGGSFGNARQIVQVRDLRLGLTEHQMLRELWELRNEQ